MNSLPTIPLFSAGQIVATPGALALLEQANQSPLEFLSRHLRGDWGDLRREGGESLISFCHGAARENLLEERRALAC
jgi:hypothetical protein